MRKSIKWERLQRISDVSPLSDGELHIWKINSENFIQSSPVLYEILSVEEKQRAERFHFENDKIVYICARSILRMLLSKYINQDYSSIDFNFNEYGKPELPEVINPKNIKFNVSHSENLVLIGFIPNVSLGVDIEYILPNSDLIEIASKYFSSKEIDSLIRFPGEKRTEAFFNCWTRKEAFIKAVGEGLSYPLDKFSVSLNDEFDVEITIENNQQESSQWKLISFQPEERFAGAFAVKGQIKKINFFELTKLLR